MIMIAIVVASVVGWEVKPLPSVDTEFRERIESVLSDGRSLQAGGASRLEVERHVQRIVKELFDAHGKAGFIEQCVALTIEQSEMGANARTVLFTSQLMQTPSLGIDSEDIVRALVPYLPADEPHAKRLIEREYLAGVDTDQSAPKHFMVDFSLYADILRRDSSQSHGGLIDYMFRRHALMAWLAMLDIDGADESVQESLYQKVVAVLHPYNEYYRTRPDELPPGTREGLHELLVEYSHDDSLWARVFAAEVLNKVPYMRDPEIEKALLADPHWLIQRRLAYRDEEPEPADE